MKESNLLSYKRSSNALLSMSLRVYWASPFVPELLYSKPGDAEETASKMSASGSCMMWHTETRMRHTHHHLESGQGTDWEHRKLRLKLCKYVIFLLLHQNKQFWICPTNFASLVTCPCWLVFCDLPAVQLPAHTDNSYQMDFTFPDPNQQKCPGYD